MILRYVGRCLSYLSLGVIAGLFITGCVIREPRGSLRLAKRARLWMMPGRLGKQTVSRRNLLTWKDAFASTRGVLCL